MKTLFRNNIFLCVLFIFLIDNTGFSQTEKFSDIRLSAKYHYGYLLPEYSFFTYLINDHIDAFEFNIQKKTSGKDLWHKLYKYPSIGFSFIYTELGNNTIFGKAYAVHPYIQFNIFNRKRFDLRYQLGIGMCYATEHFDLIENYHNIAIGSHLNIWFNTELSASYRITPIVSMTAGTAFYHLSNANLAEPNIGLNNLTFFCGIEANFNQNMKVFDDEIPEFNRKNEYSVIIAGATKHTRRFADELYFAASISFEYKRLLGHKFSIGGGSDLFYDSSVPDEMLRNNEPDIKNIYMLKTGLHVSQELIFGRLSLIIQEGIYILLKDELYKNTMYNRGIIRYKFSDHFFANLAMKSNVVVLDVMEIGLGYYWN